MRAQGLAKFSSRFVLPLLIGLLAAPAVGQSRHPMPDPFAGQTGTYQTDPSRPVQAELRDCHLFEAIGWGWGTDSLRSRLPYNEFLYLQTTDGQKFDR